MSEKSTIEPKKSKAKTVSDKTSVSGNGRTHAPLQTNPAESIKPTDHEQSPHPWAPLLGKYADDPDWDELMEAIRANREETDAEVSKVQRMAYQNWDDWMRSGEDEGNIIVDVQVDMLYDQPNWSPIPSHILFRRLNGSVRNGQIGSVPGTYGKDNRISRQSGWFSASYGPFRRFSGGDKDLEKFYSLSDHTVLAAHLSAFSEGIALTECIEWLKLIKFQSLENGNSDFLNQIINFVNQEGFLPHRARLEEISSKGVRFIDGNDYPISLDDLSDGYRSILSMTFELIRQMRISYSEHPIFSEDNKCVAMPGVVLIDEVDAHLHPSWQRRIGRWFRTHFPNVQFIVMTHSPFVCQAADVGTVFRLPKPGSEESAGMVTGVELDRLLYGNVLYAYSTDLFGTGATRSEQSREKLDRLAELNIAELDRDLTPDEQQEQERLRAMMPTAAYAVKVAAKA